MTVLLIVVVGALAFVSGIANGVLFERRRAKPSSPAPDFAGLLPDAIQSIERAIIFTGPGAGQVSWHARIRLGERWYAVQVERAEQP